MPEAYIYNVQGDVIALVDSTGSKVVEYYYDAWGKILSVTGTLATTLGTLNPFRYRGYVFDEETGLYYLRSRYYCSAKARFISADKQLGRIDQSISHNLYTYCKNCPITSSDPDGCEAVSLTAIGVAAVAEPTPFGEIAFFCALVLTLLQRNDWPRAETIPLASASKKRSEEVNWGIKDSNKTHILEGSSDHGGHDWSPFNIDPKDPNRWDKLLPLLKLATDQGERWNNPNMTRPIPYIEYYIYYFEEYSHSIVVKLYNYGTHYGLSDAFPWP